MKCKCIFILLSCFIAFALGGALAQAQTITFGVYTSDKPTEMYRKFGPIVQYLQGRLIKNKQDAQIKIKIYPSYTAAIDALVDGDCDFVRFGPASYITAKDRNSKVRLLVMEHKKNVKRFKGVFITRKNSPLSSIRELKGKTFAFGNKTSTIGRYLCQAALVNVGIHADDLKSYAYLGRHDKVALAVAMGNYDAGVVKENTFKKYSEIKGLKALGTFQNITKPWVVRAGFPGTLFQILQEAMLQLTDKKILKTLKQDGFLKTTDADYAFVRKGMAISKGF